MYVNVVTGSQLVQAESSESIEPIYCYMKNSYRMEISLFYCKIVTCYGPWTSTLHIVLRARVNTNDEYMYGLHPVLRLFKSPLERDKPPPKLAILNK